MTKSMGIHYTHCACTYYALPYALYNYGVSRYV